MLFQSIDLQNVEILTKSEQDLTKGGSTDNYIIEDYTLE